MMAGAQTTESPNEWRPRQIKVTHRVEGLVPNKLILVAETFAIQDLVTTHDDRIFRDPPRARPAAQSCSTSCKKPNVVREPTPS